MRRAEPGVALKRSVAISVGEISETGRTGSGSHSSDDHLAEYQPFEYFDHGGEDCAEPSSSG